DEAEETEETTDLLDCLALASPPLGSKPAATLMLLVFKGWCFSLASIGVHWPEETGRLGFWMHRPRGVRAGGVHDAW
ncbi:hypothetical protein V496_04182, partial [Pseudogymnoascus sp. VKM F-4515 (FW-2607)]